MKLITKTKAFEKYGTADENLINAGKPENERVKIYEIKTNEEIDSMLSEYAKHSCGIKDTETFKRFKEDMLFQAEQSLNKYLGNYEKYYNTGVYIEPPEETFIIIKDILRRSGVEFYLDTNYRVA